MKIYDLNLDEIASNQKVNKDFLSVFSKKMKIDCKILNSNFYLDSFNYFPITIYNNSFKSIFKWGEEKKYKNFFTEKFKDNFLEKKDTFKSFSNVMVLGSSPSDNYYRNILTFLPRIFFINDKEISLAIHRKSSNKFRVFLSEIFKQLNIKITKIIYLDDDFYKFKNSKIPQFFDIFTSIKILNKNLSYKKSDKKIKIFLSRQNSDSRNLINESDLIDLMQSKNFKIIDTNKMSIFEQIKAFSSASVIVGATSSSLTNSVFCNKDTKIIEIIPKYKHIYEQSFKDRYSDICKYLKLNYSSIEADPVENDNLDSSNYEFISKKFLSESNYYKNLLINKSKFEKFIEKI